MGRDPGSSRFALVREGKPREWGHSIWWPVSWHSGAAASAIAAVFAAAVIPASAFPAEPARLRVCEPQIVVPCESRDRVGEDM